MSLKKILAKIIAYMKPAPKRLGQKEEAEEKRRGIFDQLWQYILKTSIRYAQLAKQRKKNNKLIKEKTLAKKLVKKSAKANDKDVTKKKNAHGAWDESISNIERLVQGYEEFIQRDFFMIIQEANARLREWKANLVVALSVSRVIPAHGTAKLSADLIEMSELYSQSQQLLGEIVQNCTNYQDIVKDAKRQISPTQKLNQVQLQLDRMIRGLEKGTKMTYLQLNKDYQYLARYLEEKQSGRGRAL